MKRRAFFGAAVGAVAAVAGMGAVKATPAPPIPGFQMPAEPLRFHALAPNEHATGLVMQFREGEVFSWMDARGVIRQPGSDIERIIVVKIGTTPDGHYLKTRWVPGKREPVAPDFVSSAAPMDERHQSVRWLWDSGENPLRTVLVDGVQVSAVYETYEGEHGWVLRYVTDADGKEVLDASHMTLLRERVYGRVEVLPWSEV